MIDWNRLLARYQAAHGGAYFGSTFEYNDCQLILTEGEKHPILVSVDLVPTGKYSQNDISARTCVQLDGEYELKIGETSALVGGVKGLAGMLTGGGEYGYPEVLGKRSVSTNNKAFTKQMLGDLELRNALKHTRCYLTIRPTPQGEGWHMVEVGDRNFEGGDLKGGSPWITKSMTVDTVFMDPEEKVRVEQAAQAHFDKELEAFLTLLRSAVRAVTTWRM